MINKKEDHISEFSEYRGTTVHSKYLWSRVRTKVRPSTVFCDCLRGGNSPAEGSQTTVKKKHETRDMNTLGY